MDIRRFDIYRKIPKDLTQPTYTGAIVSICCCLFISFLFLSELFNFLAYDIQSELFVDDPDQQSKISVKINVTLPFIQCKYLGLDIQDEMGRHEVGFAENIDKIPSDNGEGCRIEGTFSINKVPGNFHLSTHSANKQPQAPDMRHIIHDIKFGNDDITAKYKKGSFNALSGRIAVESEGTKSHDYVLKIVPTTYEPLNGRSMSAFQYTYAHKEYSSHRHGGFAIPAIWFKYDLSPITVKYTEKRQPIYTFMTTVCAIVGGTFTVAGIIDSMFFTATEFYKKFEMGKLS